LQHRDLFGDILETKIISVGFPLTITGGGSLLIRATRSAVASPFKAQLMPAPAFSSSFSNSGFLDAAASIFQPLLLGHD